MCASQQRLEHILGICKVDPKVVAIPRQHAKPAGTACVHANGKRRYVFASIGKIAPVLPRLAAFGFRVSSKKTFGDAPAVAEKTP
jgi:hypothetical protein